MAIALLNGVVMSFDGPARQSMVAELVDKTHLFNAIALNSAAFNSARIIGPALAAILVSTIGMSGCFYLNGISFLAVLVALVSIRVEGVSKSNKKSEIVKDLLEGLRFIKRDPLILILIVSVGIISLFGVSYVILMPIFASDVLKVGVKGLGMLMSAAGAGALAAALLLAGLGDFKQRGRLLFISSIFFSLSLIVFALSKTYALSLAALVGTGAFGVMAISLVNTILQHNVPDAFRGRVMSAFMFTFAGVLPFGNLLAGSLAHTIGVAYTVAASGAVCMVFFIIGNILFPHLRKA